MIDKESLKKELRVLLLPGYYFQPKNHLENLGVESYEDYLLELVNESSFFLKKLTEKR